jgi:hypothetical protein
METQPGPRTSGDVRLRRSRVSATARSVNKWKSREHIHDCISCKNVSKCYLQLTLVTHTERKLPHAQLTRHATRMATLSSSRPPSTIAIASTGSSFANINRWQNYVLVKQNYSLAKQSTPKKCVPLAKLWFSSTKLCFGKAKDTQKTRPAGKTMV